MAKLANLPGMDIIDGFKGTIDFYVHQGQPCARKWPRSPGHKRAPAVMAQWSVWTEATRLWRTFTPKIQEAWRKTAAGSKMSGYELSIRAYISGYIRPED